MVNPSEELGFYSTHNGKPPGGPKEGRPRSHLCSPPWELCGHGLRAKVAAGETIRQTLQSPVRAEDPSEETVALQRGTYNQDAFSQV